jgi:hypothetical protein
MMLTHTEEIEADLISEDRLLDHRVHPVPGGLAFPRDRVRRDFPEVIDTEFKWHCVFPCSVSMVLPGSPGDSSRMALAMTSGSPMDGLDDRAIVQISPSQSPLHKRPTNQS